MCYKNKKKLQLFGKAFQPSMPVLKCFYPFHNFRNSGESLDFTDGPCGYTENGSGVIQIGKRLNSHAMSRIGESVPGECACLCD